MGIGSLFSTVTQGGKGIAKIISGFGNDGNRFVRSVGRIRKGALRRDIGRLQLRATLMMDPAGFVRAVARMGEEAMELMANDVREKISNSIMGNRSSTNPFPRNKVNLRTGQYYKNSIARPYPKPPRSYTLPGQPIALQQTIYRKQTDTRSTISVDGKKVKVPEFLAGPMSNSNVGIKGTPGILEKGGTTTAYYRFVPTPIGTFRQEFSKKKKPRKHLEPLPRIKAKTPVKYATWAEVKAAGERKKNDPKRMAVDNTLDPSWKGPTTFQVRGRHYVSKSWDRTKKRANHFLDSAKKRLPFRFRSNMKIRSVRLPSVQGAKP